MRYYKYFLIILIVVFGCVKKQKLKKEYNLKVSWVLIDDQDSTYYEAFYNDSTYYYYFGDDDVLTRPTKYIIKADTLIAYGREGNKEIKNINFIVVEKNDIFLINSGERKVRYIPIDSSKYTMNKIRNKKDFEKYRKAYLARKHNLIKKGLVRKDGW